MNIEEYRAYCLAKKAVTEEFPFDSETLVFKVMGKIFALTSVSEFVSVNLKCDPEKAVELRDQYAAVVPGFHMNKKHWNTIQFDGSISDKLLKTWIDESYQCVINTLPARDKRHLQSL